MHINESVEGTDTEMVAKNYISITPIHFDLTDYKTLADLKDWDIPF
jgi:5'-nucleotidase